MQAEKGVDVPQMVELKSDSTTARGRQRMVVSYLQPQLRKEAKRTAICATKSRLQLNKIPSGPKKTFTKQIDPGTGTWP